MACKCKDPLNKITLGMEDYVQVQYNGQFIVNYTGKSSGITYGNRFPSQKFLILREDAEVDSEVTIV